MSATSFAADARRTRAWIAAHPRITVTYTPKHASWLDMAELWFSALTRGLLRRGEFISRTDLAEKITCPLFALWGGREVMMLLLASLVAGLATMPYAAFHFHRVTPYGVLANLAAMPVVSALVMPAGLLGHRLPREDDGRPGVLQVVLHLAGLQQRVHGYDDRAGLEAAEEDPAVGIEVEVVGGQVRRQDQPHILEIRFGLL